MHRSWTFLYIAYRAKFLTEEHKFNSNVGENKYGEVHYFIKSKKIEHVTHNFS